MRKIRLGAAASSVLLTLVFAASAQAVPTFTTSDVTTPADGSSLIQNLDTNPNQTFTVSGTTNGGGGDLFDIDCSSDGVTHLGYAGPGGAGIALASDGSFSVTTVPQTDFAGQSCDLIVVPHGTTPLPGTSYIGARLGFSTLSTSHISSGPNNGALYDYYFDEATPLANAGADSVDNCGPYPTLVDGTTAMNTGNGIWNCGGSLYTSITDRVNSGSDLKRSEIEVDGQNAYGSEGADLLFSGSDALPGFPALTVSVDSFDTSNGNAQTTESEPLVKCTPNDTYDPNSAQCTAFTSTGVALKRVMDYTDNGRVTTVTDTYSSSDGQAHALDLWYETDLEAITSGWEFPGQSSFTTPNTTSDTTGPGASTAPGTLYAIDDISSAPSLNNPVGAATFATPYSSVTFDDTIWTPDNPSAYFDYQRMVPAGGSIAITWSYASGTSLAEVQGYAAAAQVALRPAVSITSPANGATLTKSPATVTGTAGGGSGVKGVTVNNVSATVSGGNWTASVPLTHGKNTLTATVTTDEGSTATTTASVTYAPPPRISVKSKRFNGKAVLVKLACAASGSNCRGKVTLRYTETVVKHHKKHKVAAVIARKAYSIASGHTATIKASLNGTGKRLLKAHGKLATRGTVTVTQANGHQTTGATFKLTLKQPVKRK